MVNRVLPNGQPWTRCPPNLDDLGIEPWFLCHPFDKVQRLDDVARPLPIFSPNLVEQIVSRDDAALAHVQQAQNRELCGREGNAPPAASRTEGRSSLSSIGIRRFFIAPSPLGLASIIRLGPTGRNMLHRNRRSSRVPSTLMARQLDDGGLWPEPALVRATGGSRLRNRVEVDGAASVARAVGGTSETIAVFAPNATATRMWFCTVRSVIPNTACSQAPK
jgi:hypothetical protein